MMIDAVNVNGWPIPLTRSGLEPCCTRIELPEFVCCTVRGEPTVTAVEPLLEPEDALIVDVPAALPFAKPEPFTVAADGLDEFQVAELVRSCIVPSA